VNVVLSAKGLTKARPEVLERDKARLAKWLANGETAESRPAEPVARKRTGRAAADVDHDAAAEKVAREARLGRRS
jgi:hypothetical protein